MKFVFFTILTAFLIILQSVVLPCFTQLNHFFDLMIIAVLFISLKTTRHITVVAVMAIGCFMDSISGVPFSFHVFSYLWIYIIVYIFRQLLFDQNMVFVFIISIVSVLIQHVLLLFSILVIKGYDDVMLFDYQLLIRQVFWGFLFIPVSIWVLNQFWRAWSHGVAAAQEKWEKTRKESI